MHGKSLTGAALVCALIVAQSAGAGPTASYGSEKSDTSAKIVSYAMPALAASLAIWKDDKQGLFQLFTVTALTVGTAYGLKQVVRERRPFQNPMDHSTGWDSFPSTESALSSAPSSFVWGRYGWEWGLPFFIVSKYTSYALDHDRRNRIWDGLASTALAFGYNRLITTRFRSNYGLSTGVDGGPDGVYGNITYRW